VAKHKDQNPDKNGCPPPKVTTWDLGSVRGGGELLWGVTVGDMGWGTTNPTVSSLNRMLPAVATSGPGGAGHWSWHHGTGGEGPGAESFLCAPTTTSSGSYPLQR